MRRLKGISELVKLFNSENQEVQRFATGATRNLIYENMDNKVALIEEGGILQLVEALKENDDELRKNITGRRRSGGRRKPDMTLPFFLCWSWLKGETMSDDELDATGSFSTFIFEGFVFWSFD